MAIVGFDVLTENLGARELAKSCDVALFPPPLLGPWQVRRRRRRVCLPVEARAAVGARHAIKFVCVLWSATRLYDVAAACVTELVANAVKHAAWPQDPLHRVVWLTLSVAGPYLLVEVSDPDPVLPALGRQMDWDRFDWDHTTADDGLGESGFGLRMVVERVREAGGEFGMVLGGVGKTVFFALPIDGRTPLVDTNGAPDQSAQWQAEV